MLTYDQLVADEQTLCRRALVGRHLLLGDPFPGQPYACLIWDHGSDLSQEDRRSVASWVLATDCRYVVCGGAQCEAWHNAFDEKIVEAEANSAEDSAREVMTTWHPNEPPGEVAWYLAHCTDFADMAFSHYLVLHVGSDGELDNLDRSVAEELSRRHMTATR